MEQAANVPDFLDWILPALLIFISAVAAIAVLGWLAGFVISAARLGPTEGFYAVAKQIASAVEDMRDFSLRRAWAMGILALQESIRRRVLIGFALFLLIMLFAGWYLDVQSDNPARLYLSFVLTASNYLVLVMALFLSTFSLPNDIKSRTIYTIVTKPVRPLEIVVGRIFGFTVVGTVMLVAMCGISYVFVIRGLAHGHEVEEIARVNEVSSSGDAVQWSGTATLDDHHRHDVRVYEDGYGETDLIMGHRHAVRRVGEGEQEEFEFSTAEGMLEARVPHYGYLRFLDRSGQPGIGINVGYEWAYRGYIEGGTLSAAIWHFENVTPERYPDGINLDLNLRVFRSYMGDIERGIYGSITIRNPNPAARLEGERIPFMAREFTIDRHFIPRSLKAIDKNDGSVHDVDLFEDLTDDGRVEIWIQCEEPGQYFGMAGPDAYILDADGLFWLNFIKGFAGIWLQMVLVNSFGVMFSTFLSGAVSMLATLSTIAVALFREFIIGLFSGELQGGGPVEALIRVLSQKNLVLELEIGTISMFVVRSVDTAFLAFLRILAGFLPDYFRFSTAEFVASGYNISSNLLAQHMLITLGYVLVVSMVSYFFLKLRELGA